MNQVVDLSPAVKQAQIALTVIGLSGIVLSFVAFSGDIIPLTDVLLDWDFSYKLWLLVAPCIVLPITTSLGYGLWLTTGRHSPWMVKTGYFLAALFACTTLVAMGLDSRDDPELLAITLLFAAAFAGAAWLSIKGVGHDSGVGGLVAMQSTYSVPMTFWVAFAYFVQEDFQSGAWLGVATLLAYLAQIALAAKRRWFVLAAIVPMAFIIALMKMTGQSW